MAIEIISGFLINQVEPADVRTNVQTIAERDASVFPYFGMEVFVRDTNTKYRLESDLTTWTEISGGGGGAAVVSYEEQDKVALSATSDGDKAISALITQEPADGDYIKVYIDGIKFNVGRGVKTKPFYFSGDGGVTAKGFSSVDPTGKVVAGDELYVNPSILETTLDTSQTLTIVYNIEQ